MVGYLWFFTSISHDQRHQGHSNHNEQQGLPAPHPKHESRHAPASVTLQRNTKERGGCSSTKGPPQKCFPERAAGCGGAATRACLQWGRVHQTPSSPWRFRTRFWHETSPETAEYPSSTCAQPGGVNRAVLREDMRSGSLLPCMVATWALIMLMPQDLCSAQEGQNLLVEGRMPDQPRLADPEGAAAPERMVVAESNGPDAYNETVTEEGANTGRPPKEKRPAPIPCRTQGCTRSASFGHADSRERRSCGVHRAATDINLKGRICRCAPATPNRPPLQVPSPLHPCVFRRPLLRGSLGTQRAARSSPLSARPRASASSATPTSTRRTSTSRQVPRPTRALRGAARPVCFDDGGPAYARSRAGCRPWRSPASPARPVISLRGGGCQSGGGCGHSPAGGRPCGARALFRVLRGDSLAKFCTAHKPPGSKALGRRMCAHANCTKVLAAPPAHPPREPRRASSLAFDHRVRLRLKSVASRCRRLGCVERSARWRAGCTGR